VTSDATTDVMDSTATALAYPVTETNDRAAILGDFDALVRAEQRRVYRVIFAMVRDADVADSLTQECFLKAYRHRDGYRGAASARTWLLRIAVNLARDHAKSRRLQFWKTIFRRDAADAPEPEPVDPHASPERILLAREEAGQVWAAVDLLSAQQRAVFVLRFMDEMNIEQIAEATCLRPGTVKAHLFRAISAVRQRLQERQK
jgi:RNA polymerase sigma-70 factor (ECF subfamily)